MTNNIKLHKNDLPDDLQLGNVLAVDGEFMGLNVRRDPLCLIQISSGNSDAHIVQFDRKNYNAPNLTRLLDDENIIKIFHVAIGLLFVASIITSCCVASLGFEISPVICPSFITSTRSLMPKISGNSELIIKIAFPFSASWLIS